MKSYVGIRALVDFLYTFKIPNTSPASPSRVSDWVPMASMSETKGGKDADSTVVEADGGMVVEVGGLDISDTKLVGILALPDDERRLYECEGGCLGLSK